MYDVLLKFDFEFFSFLVIFKVIDIFELMKIVKFLSEFVKDKNNCI